LSTNGRDRGAHIEGMATLTVIRHGQASFLAENYDQLSELGRQQAQLLGEYWLRLKVTFDCVFTGPRERQKDTAGVIGEMFRAAGREWPEAVVLEDLDEYPAEPVVRTFTPLLAGKHTHIREWANEFESCEDIATKKKALDRIIQEVTARWLEGEVADPLVGSWDDFTSRVHRAIGVARAATPRGGATAVFTSGGPSAAAVQYAIGLSPRATLDLTWMTRNAAFAEFIFDSERFNLSVFNATPHLVERELLTYR
jgi:broad specificity phosphatase PhoE